MRIPGLAANLELSFVSVSVSENTREMLDCGKADFFMHCMMDKQEKDEQFFASFV